MNGMSVELKFRIIAYDEKVLEDSVLFRSFLLKQVCQAGDFWLL
jgi:hypothetical protein